MAMNALRSVTRVGSRMFSATGVALVVMFGCLGDSTAVGMGQVVSAEYPSVDASFLSALEWRFVGPFRGGRVPAVAGDADDPLVFYFGAAHGGVWKTTDAGMHWWNVSDGFFEFPAVGALDVSLSDPQVIFAGTDLLERFLAWFDKYVKGSQSGS